MTTTSPDIDIRPLTLSERAQWEPLWQGYLDFYKTVLPPEVTDETWRRFHDAAEPTYLRGAFIDGELVGIVQFILHRSNWMIELSCYLQDLFTVESARGRGVGRALIERVSTEIKAMGGTKVHWLTHETNTHAQVLYDKIAARSGNIQYVKML